MDFDREIIYQTTILVLFILVDRILNSECIINNGNILTDGRWKCYYQYGKRYYRRLIKISTIFYKNDIVQLFFVQ